MDWVSNEEKNFLYHVWIYVHEEEDVKDEVGCLNEIQDHVTVGWVNDFLREFVQFDVDELSFEFQTKRIE